MACVEFCMSVKVPSRCCCYTDTGVGVGVSVVKLRPFSWRCSVVACARRRSIASSKKMKNKQGLRPHIEEDAFEALFKQLEEDLKNDGLSLDDDNDDEITEEDLIKLERELEEALAADDDLLGFFDDHKNQVDVVKNKKSTTVNDKEIEINNPQQEEEDESEYEYEDKHADDYEDEKENEDDGPLELKRWQLRRLAYALKDGRRKTSIKNLAADLCLDRGIVLELLRDPPRDLLMLSASLPDKPNSRILEPVIKPEDAILLATERDAISGKTISKTPVHQMQSSWSAQKRLKKVHVETLERVYRRSKRPTNAMISNIVHVTKIPRKKVLKWFEDKRGEDGVPDHRLPYERDIEAETKSEIGHRDATEVKNVI